MVDTTKEINVNYPTPLFQSEKHHLLQNLSFSLQGKQIGQNKNLNHL